MPVSLETLEKIADTVHFEKKVDDKVLVETASTTTSKIIVEDHQRPQMPSRWPNASTASRASPERAVRDHTRRESL